MKLFINHRDVRGPYGGANSFLRSLKQSLKQKGITITNRVDAKCDIALLNALTDGIDLNFVRSIYERGVPIIHRKVGYIVSGGPDMRKIVNEVVEGDRKQLEFSKYVNHTIFQSAYSRNVFIKSGFIGDYTIIHNGVDDNLFNIHEFKGLLRKKKDRRFWDGCEPFRLIISSWSTDPNKGFNDYAKIDREIEGRKDVKVSYVGRKPGDLDFKNIETFPPMGHRKLAGFLKKYHAMIQMARNETCSNALIEGINCGLPVIYLDSGSNKEIAENYGVEYKGNFFGSLHEVQRRYSQIIKRIGDNPYKISRVTDEYIKVIEKVHSCK